MVGFLRSLSFILLSPLNTQRKLSKIVKEIEKETILMISPLFTWLIGFTRFYFLYKYLNAVRKYLHLPSFNSIVLKVSDKSGCNIQTNRTTTRERYEESIRVPFLCHVTTEP